MAPWTTPSRRGGCGGPVTPLGLWDSVSESNPEGSVSKPPPPSRPDPDEGHVFSEERLDPASRLSSGQGEGAAC